MKLLVIEDERSLLQSILEYFTQEDFLCEGVATAAEAINKIDFFTYDCILLDVNLPDGSGLTVLEYLRKHKKEEGVIIISARDALDDKIAGLNFGADDYITKPFHLSELNARIKALIRRKYTKGVDELEAGNLRLNLSSRTAACGDRIVPLTKNEYDLLVYLVNNKNRVVDRQAIAEHIYGEQADNMPSFDFVYSHVKNLKKKLKDRGCDDLIQTVYGLGYKLTL